MEYLMIHLQDRDQILRGLPSANSHKPDKKKKSKATLLRYQPLFLFTTVHYFAMKHFGR